MEQKSPKIAHKNGCALKMETKPCKKDLWVIL